MGLALSHRANSEDPMRGRHENERAMGGRTRFSRAAVTAALAGACMLSSAEAVAASNPKAITLRFKCRLVGVHGTPDLSTAECKNLNGWFDGQLRWFSGTP